MSTTRLLRCVVFLSTVLEVLPAQSNDVSFRRISLDDGLVQSSVTCIVQDRHGFLWFGTQGGLNRYDGYSFSVFTHRMDDSTSLAHSLISALHVDRFGVLWVGTQNGVVHRFDERTEAFRRYVIGPETQQVRQSREIQAITVDADGTVWATYQSGFARLAKGDSAFVVEGGTLPGFATKEEERYRTIWSDPAGNVWLGERGAIRRRDAVSKIWRDAVIVYGPLPEGSVSFEDFFTDNNATLWVGSTSGLFRFDASRNAFVIETDDGRPMGQRSLRGVVLSAAVDKEGYIWVGAFTGVFRYHPVRKSVDHFEHNPSDPYSLSELTGVSTFVERNGIVFIGTHAGVNVYAPWQIKFRTVQNTVNDPTSLSWNNVRGFAEDGEGNVWAATLRGLNRSNGSGMRFERYLNKRIFGTEVADDLVWTVAAQRIDGGNRIWVGSNSYGVALFDRVSVRGTIEERYYGALIRGCIQSFIEDSDGGMWVGILGGGLVHVTKNLRVDQEYVHDPANPRGLSNNGVFSIAFDAQDRLWIGTDNGLNIMESPGQFRVYRHDAANRNSPSGNNILCIMPDEEGNIWFGTYAGLNRLHTSSGTFTHYDESDGLPNSVIYAILRDDAGRLWLSTNAGIARFDPSTEEVVSYTTSQGLQSNEYNQRAAMRTSSGHMYFGGVNGFNVFHPDSLVSNPYVPRAVLTEVRLMNSPVHPRDGEQRLRSVPADADTLFLSYRDAVITFQYAALDYTSPEATRYAYFMEGFDEQWMQAGNRREVTYTNLDPGDYVFHVSASNSDNVWSVEPTSVLVQISPPFWKTWWFRGTGVCLFLSIGPLIYIRRVTKLKRDVAVQQEFSRRLLQSQESERARIARELHDGLGQDLLVVKNRAVLGLKTAAAGSKPAVQLDEISQTVTEAIKAVREIARNLRPYQLDSLGLTEAIRGTLTKISESSGIKIIAELDVVDRMFSAEVESSLFRIVQETANNLVKHSGAGMASYVLRCDGNKVTLTIADNGRGFDTAATAAKENKGMGLSGITERVRMMGGEYTLTSHLGRGTTHRIALIRAISKT